REAHVGLAHAHALRAEVSARLHDGGLERVGEAVEGGRAHRGADVVLVAEVAIGRHGATAERGSELAHADAVAPLSGEAVLRHRAEPRAEGVHLGRREVLRHAQASGGTARGNSRTNLKKRARCRSEATSVQGRKRMGSGAGASSAIRRWTKPRRLSSVAAAFSRPPSPARTPKT